MALPIPTVVTTPNAMPRTKFGIPPLLNLVTVWPTDLTYPPITDPALPGYQLGDHTAVTHILYRIISSRIDFPTRNGEPESPTNQALTTEGMFHLFGALSEPEWSTDSMWSDFSGMATSDSRWSTFTELAPAGSIEDSEWSNIVQAILSTDPTTDSEWAELSLRNDVLFPDNMTDLDERQQSMQLRDVLEQRNVGVEGMAGEEGVRVDPPMWHLLPDSNGAYSYLRYFDLVFPLSDEEILMGRHQSIFSGELEPVTDNLNPAERCYWVMAVLGVDANDILRGYDATP